jgi:hypothetical protein
VLPLSEARRDLGRSYVPLSRMGRREVAGMASEININDALDGHVILDVECLDRICGSCL